MRAKFLPSITALMTSLVTLIGCDPMEAEDAADGGAVYLRPSGANGGVWLNTSAIGDHVFAALDLKKQKNDGVRLDRVLIKRPNNAWIEADKVWTEDGEIRALKGTTFYTGMQLVGSKWELTLVAGTTETPATMWVATAANAAGAWRYSFQHNDSNGAVADLCDPDGAGNTTAVPIADLAVDATTGDLTTRNNTLYLACVSGAIGKAVTWGYQPWDIGVPEFESAVRVVRADYCGDGVSWTTPGSAVQLADVWGVNSFGTTSAATEAVWGANGALCLGTPRVTSSTPITCGGVAIPACASNAGLGTTAGATVWSKLAPQ